MAEKTAETEIHDSMSGLALEIYSKYGVTVNNASFKWAELDSGDPDERVVVLKEVSIATTMT